MNLKFLLAVIAIGAVMFFAGRSLSLFQETFFNNSRLVEELPLSATGSMIHQIIPQGSRGSVQTSVPADNPICRFETAHKPSHRDFILNEVAWMGNAESALNEWIELKNISQSPVDVSGWQLEDKDEQINFVFPKNSKIGSQGFYLLERKGEATLLASNALYAGNLKNTDEGLRLFDPQCNLVDEVLASPDWPAGDNKTKRTMERASDFSWYTSSKANGTPAAENSEPLHLNVVVQKQKEVTVSSTIPVVSASSSSAGSTIENWNLKIDNSSLIKVLISEVMAGMDGNANYEFIELYNPNAQAVALTGWSVRKRSAAGNESPLVVASRFEGKVIPAQKHFLLANQGGYNGPVAADVAWPASYTLAYTNNAVVLYDASGIKAEEVSWSEISKNQSLERDSWNNNQFHSQGTPTPQNSSY